MLSILSSLVLKEFENVLIEISQKEKNKYYLLKHICGIQKYGMKVKSLSRV